MQWAQFSVKQVLFTVLHFSIEAPIISSTTVSFFFFHYSSYKYAEMKYTLLLVVNDVLWSSLCLWIVLCLLCMVYQISIYDEKMSKPPEFCCILIKWDSCETN